MTSAPDVLTARSGVRFKTKQPKRSNGKDLSMSKTLIKDSPDSRIMLLEARVDSTTKELTAIREEVSPVQWNQRD